MGNVALGGYGITPETNDLEKANESAETDRRRQIEGPSSGVDGVRQDRALGYSERPVVTAQGLGAAFTCKRSNQKVLLQPFPCCSPALPRAPRPEMLCCARWPREQSCVLASSLSQDSTVFLQPTTP